jgi:gamma-glutamyl:cysteine ligase YbdK (ATP-grasp superfamily)
VTDTDTGATVKAARVIIEVQAGLLPGRPDPEYSRRWALTSEEWNAADDGVKGQLLAELNGRAQGYAGWLMMLPDRLNWVHVDWVYL